MDLVKGGSLGPSGRFAGTLETSRHSIQTIVTHCLLCLFPMSWHCCLTPGVVRKGSNNCHNILLGLVRSRVYHTAMTICVIASAADGIIFKIELFGRPAFVFFWFNRIFVCQLPFNWPICQQLSWDDVTLSVRHPLDLEKLLRICFPLFSTSSLVYNNNNKRRRRQLPCILICRYGF
jgi:hypothetical protein